MFGVDAEAHPLKLKEHFVFRGPVPCKTADDAQGELTHTRHIGLLWQA